jgi:hypothetical protein
VFVLWAFRRGLQDKVDALKALHKLAMGLCEIQEFR